MPLQLRIALVLTVTSLGRAWLHQHGGLRGSGRVIAANAREVEQVGTPTDVAHIVTITLDAMQAVLMSLFSNPGSVAEPFEARPSSVSTADAADGQQEPPEQEECIYVYQQRTERHPHGAHLRGSRLRSTARAVDALPPLRFPNPRSSEHSTRIRSHAWYNSTAHGGLAFPALRFAVHASVSNHSWPGTQHDSSSSSSQDALQQAHIQRLVHSLRFIDAKAARAVRAYVRRVLSRANGVVAAPPTATGSAVPPSYVAPLMLAPPPSRVAALLPAPPTKHEDASRFRNATRRRDFVDLVPLAMVCSNVSTVRVRTAAVARDAMAALEQAVGAVDAPAHAVAGYHTALDFFLARVLALPRGSSMSSALVAAPVAGPLTVLP